MSTQMMLRTIDVTNTVQKLRSVLMVSVTGIKYIVTSSCYDHYRSQNACVCHYCQADEMIKYLKELD